jgi:hypothetical protein
VPDEVWATLVLAVDIVGDADPDRVGEVALFRRELGARAATGWPV